MRFPTPISQLPNPHLNLNPNSTPTSLNVAAEMVDYWNTLNSSTAGVVQKESQAPKAAVEKCWSYQQWATGQEEPGKNGTGKRLEAGLKIRNFQISVRMRE